MNKIIKYLIIYVAIYVAYIIVLALLRPPINIPVNYYFIFSFTLLAILIALAIALIIYPVVILVKYSGKYSGYVQLFIITFVLVGIFSTELVRLIVYFIAEYGMSTNSSMFICPYYILYILIPLTIIPTLVISAIVTFFGGCIMVLIKAYDTSKKEKKKQEQLELDQRIREAIEKDREERSNKS